MFWEEEGFIESNKNVDEFLVEGLVADANGFENSPVSSPTSSKTVPIQLSKCFMCQIDIQGILNRFQ